MKTVLKFFDHLCRVYTVTAVLFLLLNLAVAGNAENTVIRPEAFLLVLPFAAGFSLANVFYGAIKLPHALRLIVHFLTVTVCAYLFLYLPAGTGASTGMKFLMWLIVALIYWLFMGGYLMIGTVYRRSKPSEREYRSVFKK